MAELPVPCMVCNRELKFGKLLDLAKTLECDAIATGHYARVEQHPETGRYLLRKALDMSAKINRISSLDLHRSNYDAP